MSQRDSGYERLAFDQYETPEWSTLAVVPHLPQYVRNIWEPASGTGKMVRALESAGYDVLGSDIQEGLDFFRAVEFSNDAIVTNPPYNLATEFIEHSLHLTRQVQGAVAMLLRADFDSAKGRAHLFANNPAFAKKVILTKRIVWVEKEGKKAAPSFNHAWYIMDWRHKGPPTIAYHFEGK